MNIACTNNTDLACHYRECICAFSSSYCTWTPRLTKSTKFVHFSRPTWTQRLASKQLDQTIFAAYAPDTVHPADRRSGIAHRRAKQICLFEVLTRVQLPHVAVQAPAVRVRRGAEIQMRILSVQVQTVGQSPAPHAEALSLVYIIYN